MEKGQVDVDVEQVAALLKKGESIDTKKLAGRYREIFRALALPFSPAARTISFIIQFVFFIIIKIYSQTKIMILYQRLTVTITNFNNN